MCEYIAGSYSDQSQLRCPRSYRGHQGIQSYKCSENNPSLFLILVIFLQDIFRKYPNKYESIISTLCENLDSLDESEARYDKITHSHCCLIKPDLHEAILLYFKTLTLSPIPAPAASYNHLKHF